MDQKKIKNYPYTKDKRMDDKQTDFNQNHNNNKSDDSDSKNSNYDSYLSLLIHYDEVDQIRMILRREYKINDESKLGAIVSFILKKEKELKYHSIKFLNKFEEKSKDLTLNIDLMDYLHYNFAKYCDKHHISNAGREVLKNYIITNNKLINKLSNIPSSNSPVEYLKNSSTLDSNGFALYLGVKSKDVGEINLSMEKDSKCQQVLNEIADINSNSLVSLHENINQVNDMYLPKNKYVDFVNKINDVDHDLHKLLSEPAQCSFINPLIFSMFFLRDKVFEKYFINTSIARAILPRAHRFLDNRVNLVVFDNTPKDSVTNDADFILRLAYDHFNAAIKNTNNGKFAFTADIYNRVHIQMIMWRNIYALRTGVYVENSFSLSKDNAAFVNFLKTYEFPLCSDDDYAICHLYKILNVFALNTLSTVLYDYNVPEVSRSLSLDYSHIKSLPLRVMEIVNIPVINFKISDVIQYVKNQQSIQNNSEYFFTFNQDMLDKIPDTFLNERNIVTKYKKTLSILHDFLVVYINRRTLSSVIPNINQHQLNSRSIHYQFSYGTYKHVDNRDSYYYFNDEFFGVDIMFQFGDKKLFLKSFITTSFEAIPSIRKNDVPVESSYVLEYCKPDNKSVTADFSDQYDIKSIYCYDPNVIKISDHSTWFLKNHNNEEILHDDAMVGGDDDLTPVNFDSKKLIYKPIIQYSKNSFKRYMKNINRTYCSLNDFDDSKNQEKFVNILLNSLPIVNYHDTMITDYIDVLKRFYVHDDKNNLPSNELLDFYPTLLFKLMLGVIEKDNDSNLNPIICNFSNINRFYTLAKKSYLDVQKVESANSLYCYDYFAHFDNNKNRKSDVYYKNVNNKLLVNPHFLYPSGSNENSYDKRSMIDVLFSDYASVFRFHPIKLSNEVPYVHNNFYKFAYTLKDNLITPNWNGDMNDIINVDEFYTIRDPFESGKPIQKFNTGFKIGCGLGYRHNFFNGDVQLDFGNVYLNRSQTDEKGMNYLHMDKYEDMKATDGDFKDDEPFFRHLIKLSKHSAKVRATLHGEQSILPFVCNYILTDKNSKIENVLNMFATNKILTTMTLFENVVEPQELAYIKLFTDVPIIEVNGENNYCKAFNPYFMDNDELKESLGYLTNLGDVVGDITYHPLENINKFKVFHSYDLGKVEEKSIYDMTGATKFDGVTKNFPTKDLNVNVDITFDLYRKGIQIADDKYGSTNEIMKFIKTDVELMDILNHIVINKQKTMSSQIGLYNDAVGHPETRNVYQIVKSGSLGIQADINQLVADHRTNADNLEVFTNEVTFVGLQNTKPAYINAFPLNNIVNNYSRHFNDHMYLIAQKSKINSREHLGPVERSSNGGKIHEEKVDGKKLNERVINPFHEEFVNSKVIHDVAELNRMKVKAVIKAIASGLTQNNTAANGNTLAIALDTAIAAAGAGAGIGPIAGLIAANIDAGNVYAASVNAGIIADDRSSTPLMRFINCLGNNVNNVGTAAVAGNPMLEGGRDVIAWALNYIVFNNGVGGIDTKDAFDAVINAGGTNYSVYKITKAIATALGSNIAVAIWLDNQLHAANVNPGLAGVIHAEPGLHGELNGVNPYINIPVADVWGNGTIRPFSSLLDLNRNIGGALGAPPPAGIIDVLSWAFNRACVDVTANPHGRGSAQAGVREYYADYKIRPFNVAAPQVTFLGLTEAANHTPANLSHVARMLLFDDMIKTIYEKYPHSITYPELEYILTDSDKVESLIDVVGDIPFKIDQFRKYVTHKMLYSTIESSKELLNRRLPHGSSVNVMKDNIYIHDGKQDDNKFMEYSDLFIANKLQPKIMQSKRLFNFRNINDIVLMSTFGYFLYKNENENHPNRYICNLDYTTNKLDQRMEGSTSKAILHKLNEMYKVQREVHDNVKCYFNIHESNSGDLSKCYESHNKLSDLCFSNLENVELKISYESGLANVGGRKIGDENDNVEIVSSNKATTTPDILSIYKMREYLAYSHLSYSPHLFFVNYLKVSDSKGSGVNEKNKLYNSKGMFYKRIFENSNDHFSKFNGKKEVDELFSCKIDDQYVCDSTAFKLGKYNLYSVHGEDEVMVDYKAAVDEDSKINTSVNVVNFNKLADQLYDIYNSNTANVGIMRADGIGLNTLAALHPAVLTTSNNADGIGALADHNIGLKSGVIYAKKLASLILSYHHEKFEELKNKVAGDLSTALKAHLIKNETRKYTEYERKEMKEEITKLITDAANFRRNATPISANPSHFGNVVGFPPETLEDAIPSINGALLTHVRVDTNEMKNDLSGQQQKDIEEAMVLAYVGNAASLLTDNLTPIPLNYKTINDFEEEMTKTKEERALNKRNYYSDAYLNSALSRSLDKEVGKYSIFKKSKFYEFIKTDMYSFEFKGEKRSKDDERNDVNAKEEKDRGTEGKVPHIGITFNDKLYQFSDIEGENKIADYDNKESKDIIERKHIVSPEGLLMAKLHHVYNSFAKTLNKHYFYNDSQDYDYEVLQTPDTLLICDKNGELDQVNCNFLYHTNIINVLKYYNLKEFEPETLECAKENEMKSMPYYVHDKAILANMKYPHQFLNDKYERKMLSMDSHGDTVDSLYALADMTGIGYTSINREGLLQGLINVGLDSSFSNNHMMVKKRFASCDAKQQYISYDKFAKINNIFSLATKNINKIIFDKECKFDILESQFNREKSHYFEYEEDIKVSFKGDHIYHNFKEMMEYYKLPILNVGNDYIYYHNSDKMDTVHLPHYTLNKCTKIDEIKDKNDQYEYITHYGTKHNMFKGSANGIIFNEKITGVAQSNEDVLDGHKLFKMPYYEKDSLNPFNIYKFTSKKQKMKSHSLNTEKMNVNDFMNSFSSIMNDINISIGGVQTSLVDASIPQYYQYNNPYQTTTLKNYGCVNTFRNQLKQVLSYLIKPNVEFKNNFTSKYSENKDGEILYKYMRRLIDDEVDFKLDDSKALHDQQTQAQAQNIDKLIDDFKYGKALHENIYSQTNIGQLKTDDSKMKSLGIGCKFSDKNTLHLRKLDLFKYTQLKVKNKYVPKFNKIVHCIDNTVQLFKKYEYNVDEINYSESDIESIRKSLYNTRDKSVIEKLEKQFYGVNIKMYTIKDDEIKKYLSNDVNDVTFSMNNLSKFYDGINIEEKDIDTSDKQFLPFHMYNHSEYNIVTSFDDALINYIKTTEEKETYLSYYKKNIALPNDAYFHLMPGVGLCKTSSILIYTTDSGCESNE